MAPAVREERCLVLTRRRPLSRGAVAAASVQAVSPLGGLLSVNLCRLCPEALFFLLSPICLADLLLPFGVLFCPLIQLLGLTHCKLAVFWGKLCQAILSLRHPFPVLICS